MNQKNLLPWKRIDSPQTETKIRLILLRGNIIINQNFCITSARAEISLSAFDITKTWLVKYTENFTTKNWKFSDKKSDILHISAQKIGCEYSLEPPRRGGSNAYTQSMFLSRNKKNNAYPCKPQFYNIIAGFKGGQNYIRMISWW